jgi:CRISPR-associated protein Csx10
VRHFALTLEALSPLAIRADHAAVGSGSSGYLSGTALAGSLASAHRLFHPNDDTLFEQLFLSGQVHYPDLYPAAFKSEAMRGAETLPVSPLPKTAQSCKRFPGFFPVRDEEPDDDRHGVRDTLLDWARFELYKATLKESGQRIDTTELLKPLVAHKTCQQGTCRQPMERFGGYYRRDDNLPERNTIIATPATRLQTHTGINRETGTVQESILYHRRVFQEETRFWGLVKTSDAAAGPFKAFIEEVGLSGLVRVGTSRTRGMGKVHLSVQPVDEEPDRFERFKHRLALFSTRLRDQAGEMSPASGPHLTPDPFYFALTLHSPLILRDDLLRYRGTIDEDTLRDLLHLPRHPFTRVYQAASVRRISGWHDLWGTPRTNEYAIDTGSVFLFASAIAPAEGEPSAALWQELFRLEEEGAGRRRAEGFGRVCVSDPFHLEEQPK